jgi:hypothetical protein
MDKPEALRLEDVPRIMDNANAELRRLRAENASLAAALASSCDEQRHELWESGGIAGCERARVAERQRDALLEALKTYGWHTEDCPQYPTHARPKNWPACTCGFDDAIKAVKEGK